MRRVYRDGTVKVLRAGRWVPEHKAILAPVMPQVEEPDFDDADEEE
jgi:hypothetical protein